jgi:hypothetical protein
MTTVIARRQLLALLGLGCAGLHSRAARATLVRGLTLEALSRGSDRIVVGAAVDSSSHWEDIGGKRRIVTDSRVRIERTIAGAASGSELLVRTHGGKMGLVGELVFGEAELTLNAQCVLFLRAKANEHYVLGMAQGHYPLRTGSQRSPYLQASPNLPELLHPETSAVRRLSGQELGRAQALIQGARR